MIVIEAQGALQLAVAAPGAANAVKLVIALPPSFTGAAKVTVACPLPAVAATLVGASGTVITASAELVSVAVADCVAPMIAGRKATSYVPAIAFAVAVTDATPFASVPT